MIHTADAVTVTIWVRVAVAFLQVHCPKDPMDGSIDQFAWHDRQTKRPIADKQIVRHWMRENPRLTKVSRSMMDIGNDGLKVHVRRHRFAGV